MSSSERPALSEVEPALVVQARVAVEQSQSLEEALRSLGRLADSLGVWRASVRLVQGDELVVVGVWSMVPTELAVGTSIPITSPAFLEVVHEGGPVVHDHSDEHPSLLDQLLREEGSRSRVVIPLHENRKVVGVLALMSRISRAFRREDAPVYAALGRAIEGSLLGLVKQSGSLPD